MKFPLLSIISFLTVVLAVATHAALAPENYWKSMLPTTPMPESLKDLLHPTGGGATAHGVSDTPKILSKVTYKQGYKHSESDDLPRILSKVTYKQGYKHSESDDSSRILSKVTYKQGYKHSESDDMPKILSRVTYKQGYKHGESDDMSRILPKIMYKHGGSDDMSRILSKVTYKQGYKHGETDDTPEIMANETIFFLEKDLREGQKMNLLFMETSNDHASFLPRQVVKSIPFSSTKIDEILNKFGVKRGSAYAELMKRTIKACEETGIKGEEKHCATSLESMVDFATLELGKNAKAFSMEAMKKETKMQEYTIMDGVKKVGDTQVVCHKMNYVYAVFYCHKIENTVAYTVSLQGADGSRVKALCVCHKDTSDWNPKHLAFKLLKVKPGSVPICHFLSQSTVLWVPKQNQYIM